MDHPTPILQATNLKKSYAAVEAIKGVDINIQGSGVFAILGQNGAGKTSLIKCALGLEKITSGDLKIMGHQPGSLKAKRQTGVILQDSDLPDLLTIREQITLFASYYPNPFSVQKTIEMCELEAFADKRYKKLSGGQKRRAQFALAIVGDPQLIFLDEPTTGLDIEARRNLWAVIRGFAEQGKTIVLTTHYLEEAENLADRIMIMNSGVIVADASPNDIQKQTTGSVIRCETNLSEEQLRSIVGVTSVSISGRFSEISSVQINQTLLEVLKLDRQLVDLTVSQPKLEDVFSQLSRTKELDHE
ncbi:ABC transporter ATP-binding protein [Aliiglaciecola sp. 2_MG-2023]|uniref:ABC transporter ATP-binding protein n=1 Tax=unclassified Aliiglaciecola TaxID=2593648 RepID=UPI0026E13C52|nr:MULTISPECIES: ABC transporter ATP-binding protein [unclassified Aliiglaciecola]MDO6713114.1 ABC transporter ATP-binding protein [Aliiglaciecola sp. 2_MG-2023]MDO6754120.1 ABC transporter ATP-binding protein [Aliiglaciecola sp. 1_MG-2023]